MEMGKHVGINDEKMNKTSLRAPETDKSYLVSAKEENAAANRLERFKPWRQGN